MCSWMLNHVQSELLMLLVGEETGAMKLLIEWEKKTLATAHHDYLF